MKRHKIYTLTCTWASSYGAVLQAYGLVKMLQNVGNDVKVLNYQPAWGLYRNSSLKKIFLPLFDLKERVLGHYYLDFMHEQNIITPKIYRTNEELFGANLQASAFIVGSDQVWNCTKYYNGKDNAMFLDFAQSNQKRISYAASLAMQNVPDEQVSRYKSLLGKFDAISVREKTGAKALTAIGVKDVEVVIDPVYLVSQNEWSILAERSKRRFSGKRYLLIVCLEHRDELYQYAKKKADMLGVELYAFKGGIRFWEKNPLVNKTFWNISVYDYLNIIKNAEAVVADSFHAMSFSLIFGRDIDIIPRNDQGNSRMVDLLNELGIIDRVTSADVVLEESIDFVKVNDAIQTQVSAAQKFLVKALNGSSSGRHG